MESPQATLRYGDAGSEAVHLQVVIKDTSDGPGTKQKPKEKSAEKKGSDEKKPAGQGRKQEQPAAA